MHNFSDLYSDVIKCDKLDVKCKTQKFLDKTKEFQKKKFDEGQQQLKQTRKKLEEVKDEAIKKIPKIN